MKKIVILLGCMVVIYTGAYSQLYMTRTGFVGFYSKTPMEDIKAENHQAYAVIDVGKKNIAIALLLKSFIFPKELMQEHFNENYMESDKYPKASFSGAYTGDIVLNKEGLYIVAVNGNLTMHGVTRPVSASATLEVKNEKLLGQAHFKISPEDYHVIIPSLVRAKINKELVVMVNIDCNPVK